MEIEHKVKRKIDPIELWMPIERKNRDKYPIQTGTLNNGTHFARYRWRKEGLPHDEQFLWIFWAETRKQIKEVVDEHVKFTEQANMAGIVEIAADVFVKNLLAQITFFSDGETCLKYKKVVYNPEEESPIKGIIEGYIAVVSGQGRYVDISEPGVTGIICSLIAYAFPKKRNKFFRYFRWKFYRCFEFLKNAGVNVEGLEQIKW
jgi:hypothetical protein